MRKVEIGGKERPVRFSYLCLKDICEKTEIKLSDMQQLGSEIDHIGIMTYYGLKHGAKKEGLTFKHSIKEIETWLDDEDFSKLNEIFEAFQFDQPQNEGK
jgi:hypothetical protein